MHTGLLPAQLLATETSAHRASASPDPSYSPALSQLPKKPMHSGLLPAQLLATVLLLASSQMVLDSLDERREE